MPDPFYPDGLIREAQYQETMTSRVLPFLASARLEKTVRTYDGKDLHTELYRCPDARGSVVIVHGFTSTCVKYAELIRSLLINRYSVLIYDQRGHGRSFRPGRVKDLCLTNVNHFSDYVSDLESVLSSRAEELPGPRFLLAHSMGGAVSALYLEAHPDAFKIAVLCSPMFAPATGGMPAWVSRALCGAASLIGQGDRRIFVSKPYAGPEDFDTSCATSRARFEWYDLIRATNPFCSSNGPSYRWTLEALNVTAQVLRERVVEKISVPVRVYQAELEFMVLPWAQEAFVKRLPHGELIPVRGARHEIYRSADDVLVPWWQGVLDFLGEEPDPGPAGE